MTNGKKLESGFYGIKILDACVYLNKNRTGRHIKIAYDILSPEPFRDFFDSDYMHQQKEDQKWNGYIYLPIPYPGKKYNSSSIKKKFDGPFNIPQDKWDEMRAAQTAMNGKP